ncbi:tape measure protein [Bacteroides sp.]|uniref:tape measure protein n=1 Tax=Bacteroides sp. TaxID=29523 RepID=UPI002631BE43|nr:tape measure protein [Bacteroides sp.]
MDLNFDVAGNTADFVKNAEQMSSVIRAISSEVERQGKSIGLSMSLMSSSISETTGKSDILSGAFKKMFNVVGGKDAIKELVTEVVRVRGEFQQLEVAFGTLLGSKEKADSLMNQMMKTAAESPFSVTELATGAKQLLTYGVQAEDVNDILLNLGDIASGLGMPLEQLTTLYGKTMSQGQLYAQDLEQFTASGIPMLQGLADVYGVTTEEVNKMVSAGQVGFPEVQRVITDLTGEGGKFHNVMQEQSQTLAGKINNLRDAWEQMLNNIGESQEGVMAGAIDGAGYLLENYEGIGRILAVLVATYGAYKAAVIAVSVIESVRYQATLIQMAGMTKMQAITDILRAKTELLNKTMLSNPYILIPTLIIGVVAAMWALHDSTTAAEKAQERFNKKQEDSKNEAQDYKRKLQQLVEELQDETTAEVKKQEIRNEINKDYPTFFKFLTDEKGHIGDLTSAWKAFNEEAAKKKSTQNEASVAELKQRIAEEKRFLALMDMGYKDRQNALKNPTDMSILKKYSGKGTYSIKKDIEVDEEELRKFEKEVRNDKFLEWQGDLKNKTDKELETVLTVLNQHSKTVRGSEYLTEAYKKRIDAIELETERRKKIPAKEENTDNGQNNNDNLNTDRLDQTRKQQKDYDSLVEKNKREQARIEVDAQNSVTQSIIDAMDDDAIRTLAQRNLNHKKEVEAIQREAEDKKQALIDKGKAEFEANPTNEKKDFDVADYLKDDLVTKKIEQINEDAAKKIQSKNVQYNRGNDLTNLLAEYQDYTQKRLAVEEKFNTDITILNAQRIIAAQNGDNRQVEKIDRARAQATTEKGKTLMRLDYEKLKESPDYIRAFDNLNETSSETLNSLLSQLENAKQTAAKVLSPDQLREYTTTIQEIMDELDSRNPFQALSDKKQDLADAEQDLAKAQIELEKARQQAESVKNGGKVEYTTTKFNESTGKIETTKLYLTEAQVLEQVKNKTNEYNAAKDKTIRASAKVKKSEAEVKEEIDKLFKSISNVGEAIGGPAGEIISLIGDISSFTMSAMSGVQAAADTSATAISTVEKASVILAVISAAFQIAMKIASLFNNDEGYQKEIEKLQGRIEQLQWELDNADAIRLQNNSFKALQKVKEVYAETTEEVLKLHTANGKYLNYFDRMFLRAKSSNEILQKSAEKLALAYANIDYTAEKALGAEKFSGAKEQLQNLTQQQLLIQEQIRNEESKKKTDHGKIADWERQIQELGTKANAVINEIVEGIIGGSAVDIASELGDAFIEAFQSGENAAEAWGDKVNDIVANVLKRMLVSKYLEEPLGEIFNKYKSKWYKNGEFAGIDAIMESMGGFANDLNTVGSEFQMIWDTLPDNIKNMFSVDEEVSSQDSTRGGFESMSQETGSELNGRFTALQISNEEIKNSMLLALGNMSALCTTTSDGNILLSEMRNLALMSNGHLEDIARYTKPILGFGEKLDKIERNTANL